MSTDESRRPSEVCKALLAALDASEGRRRKRKRDQTPDAIGLAIKRQLLERVVHEDPNPGIFEEWLLQYSRAGEDTQPSGAIAAMARVVLDEWRLAHAMPDFAVWLERGAPSDDTEPVARPLSQP
ncbi:MAG TPA: hypothetical protein VGO08_01065 [Burkholderiales bacterium]|jgi:hypothetical protein|nr:hypothetical protein [Betaproteobacteria bacterium]HEV7390204.1 hypothetical protein [Burkholderiales bacterium]